MSLIPILFASLTTPLTPMGVANDTGLPSGYTACEYLQSSGTQWIYTGIVAADNIGLYVDFMFFDGNDTVVLGQCTTERNGRLSVGTQYYAFNLGWNELNRAAALPNAEYIVSVNFKNDRAIIANGAIVKTDLPTFSKDTPFEITMFGAKWRSDSMNLVGVYRVYRAQISQDTSLVRDFIPALDPSGTPCMFDRVTKTPFYNSGAGTFGYKVKGAAE